MTETKVLVCDLCNEQVPERGWIYDTRPDPDVEFEDSGWLVCGECDVLVLLKDSAGLLARWVERHQVLATNDETIAQQVMEMRTVGASMAHAHFLRTWDARRPWSSEASDV